nr:YetF domain-containing protein [Allopontixanthobacter sediminis]
MTSFDFVVTLATGSLLAAAATTTDWSALVQALSAIGGLLVAQLVLARLRRRSRRFQLLIENDPIMLMYDGKILQEALRRTRVAESDILYKLRSADIKDFTDVRCMVLESTGDISILSGETRVSEEVMREVDCRDGPAEEQVKRQV